MSARPLFIDALNFARHFFQVNKPCDLYSASSLVGRFVSAARSSNFEPRVFIDGDKHVDASEEVLNKWYARRTEEALSGKRVILQCLPQLLGDMFVEEGVPVVYSLTDNDDMIASSAAHYRGDVLSADRDYFRYSPAAQFAVFSDFLVVNEQHATARLKLIPHPNPRPRPTAETRLLKAPSECLTSARYPSIFTSVQARVYLRGCGAPDIGMYGNPHIALRPLRRALYSVLGVKSSETVREIFPVLERRARHSAQVVWTDELIYPDPGLLHVLHNPAEAVRQFCNVWQATAHTNAISRPPSLLYRESVKLAILELCWAAKPEGPTLLQLARQIQLDNIESSPPSPPPNPSNRAPFRRTRL